MIKTSNEILEEIRFHHQKFDNERQEYLKACKKTSSKFVNCAYLDCCQNWVVKELNQFYGDWYPVEEEEDVMKGYTSDSNQNFVIDVEKSLKKLQDLGFQVVSHKTNRKFHFNKGRSCLCPDHGNFFEAICKYRHYSLKIEADDDCDCGVILRVTEVVDTRTDEKFVIFCDLWCNNTSKQKMEDLLLFLECDSYDEYYNKRYKFFENMIHKLPSVFPELEYLLFSQIYDHKTRNRIISLNDFYMKLKALVKLNGIEFLIAELNGEIHLIRTDVVDPYTKKPKHENVTINDFSNYDLKSVSNNFETLCENIKIMAYGFEATYDTDGVTVVSNQQINDFVKETQSNATIPFPCFNYKKCGYHLFVSYDPIKNEFRTSFIHDANGKNVKDAVTLSKLDKQRILSFIKRNPKDNYEFFNKLLENIPDPLPETETCSDTSYSFGETRFYLNNFDISMHSKRFITNGIREQLNDRQLACTLLLVPRINDFGTVSVNKKIKGFHYPVDTYTFQFGVEDTNRPFVIVELHYAYADLVKQKTYRHKRMLNEVLGKVYGTFAELKELVEKVVKI